MSTERLKYVLGTNISRDGFWSAMEVYVHKPHVVNRRLWGSALLHSFWTSHEFTLDIFEDIGNIPEQDIKNEDTCLKTLQTMTKIQLSATRMHGNIEVSVTKQLPRLITQTCIHLMIARDYSQNVAYFVQLDSTNTNTIPNFGYSVQYYEHKIILNAQCGNISDKSFKWLQQRVLPQLVKWGEQKVISEVPKIICVGSLTLVDQEAYHTKYNNLKIKYGKEMVKIWPENTDPAKFVYEDVAIAAYLLVLWEWERRQFGTEDLQSFVDVGCGNGLLVYILSSEGHTGLGVDVRRRNIWDKYPFHVVLKEETLIPSDKHLFPQADWIIGNHSDELTPWVPVLAARSSYKCRFFLLPCCCYNFDGTKYQRRNSSKSQYAEYLEHILRLSKQCGFNTAVDRLKIPSTKRVCLIGMTRDHMQSEFNYMSNAIQSIISEKYEADQWISHFKPRMAKEHVRNCTQLDKSVVHSIVDVICQYLMRDCKKGEEWSKGNSASFSTVVKIVPNDLIKKLKSEFGGLQTLLRNNHNIFQIQDGVVQLRYPQTIEELTQVKKNRSKLRSNTVSVKKRPCWFYNHHIQGCPLTDEQCSFLHTME